MAKIEDIERRILNWVRWRDGGGGMLGFAGVRFGDGGVSGGYREAVIPTSDCEAALTDAAIKALPPHLLATIEMHYRGPWADVASQACELGCSVSTLHARVSDAHRRISCWFSDRQAAMTAERERVERLSGVRKSSRKAWGALDNEFHEL